MKKITNLCILEFKEGILFIEFTKENLVLSLEDAKQVVADRIAFVNGQPTPMCLRTSKFSYADKEVRDFMKTEGTRNITAGVFIVSNAVTSVFFNFFIKITGIDKKIPTRCFYNEGEAVKWLKKHDMQTPSEEVSTLN